MKVLWTRLALHDLSGAYEYVFEEKPSAAADLIERIEKSAEMLLSHPQLGRGGRVEATRELVVAGTPFVIAYRTKGSRIEILAVIHSVRRWADEP